MTDIYITQLLTIMIVHFLPVASPGPDFLIVTKNSVLHGRKIGIMTSLGVALGIGVHVTYCLLGIGLLISKSILLFNAIKYIGALYLIWIGLKALQSKKKNQVTEINVESKNVGEKNITSLRALKTGFLVNVLNPKATIFFLALFTQVIDVGTPKIIELLYGAEMILATFLWFTIVAIALSHEKIKVKISRIEHWVDRVSGAVLIALGIKVALSHQK